MQIGDEVVHRDWTGYTAPGKIIAEDEAGYAVKWNIKLPSGNVAPHTAWYNTDELMLFPGEDQSA